MEAALKRSRRSRNRLIKELLQDLDPEVKEYVKKLIDNYHGEELDKKLRDLIGIKKTMKLIELRE